ncbi:MAG TPA: hypothetical protein VJZ75_03290 [Candidatus Bathyarchaeia archaeon]|nr:hypothetical protein [Candidatus Bathyarchaeia archaeon]
MAVTSQKNHFAFPINVKIVLACVLIVLIVAGASLEYSRPQQSVTVTTTEFVTQAPVTVTNTVQRVGGLLQFNSSIGFSGVGKSQYSVVFNHPANVIITLCVMSQYNLPTNVTQNGAAATSFADQSTSSINQTPYAVYAWIGHKTQDRITVTFPSDDAMVLAAMAFTGRGATTTVEQESAAAWTGTNPFSVTEAAGNITGRMNSYFAVTFNDSPGTIPFITLDSQITPVGVYRQSASGSRLMTMIFGYIPNNNSSITTSYTFSNAGVS